MSALWKRKIVPHRPNRLVLWSTIIIFILLVACHTSIHSAPTQLLGDILKSYTMAVPEVQAIFNPNGPGLNILHNLNDSDILNLVRSSSQIRRPLANLLKLHPGDIPIRPSLALYPMDFMHTDPRYHGVHLCGAVLETARSDFDHRVIGRTPPENQFIIRQRHSMPNMVLFPGLPFGIPGQLWRVSQWPNPIRYPPLGPLARGALPFPLPNAGFFPFKAGNHPDSLTFPWRPDHLWGNTGQPFPEMFWCRKDNIDQWGPTGGAVADRCGKNGAGAGHIEAGATCWVCQRDNELLADWAVRQESMPLCQTCCRKAKARFATGELPRPPWGFKSCNCAGMIASYLCMRCSTESRDQWIALARARRPTVHVGGVRKNTLRARAPRTPRPRLTCPCGVDIVRDAHRARRSQYYSTVVRPADVRTPQLDLMLGGCAGDPREYRMAPPQNDGFAASGADADPNNNGWCQVCPVCLGLTVPGLWKNYGHWKDDNDGTWFSGYEENIPTWHGGNVLRELGGCVHPRSKWPLVL